MTEQQSEQTNVDLQYRTLLILWAALLGSVVMYFFMTIFIGRGTAPENHLLTIVFSALAAFLVVVSFAVKNRFLSRSVDLQEMRLVRIGSVVAWVICETAALIGLLDFLVAQDRYYFVLMALAFLGLLLHFPRRSQLVAASFGSTHTLN